MSKNFTTLTKEEFVALYMTQSTQEEVSIEELDRAYNSIVSYIEGMEDIYIAYNTNQTSHEFATKVKLFECVDGVISLADKIELTDLKVAIINRINSRTKKVMRDAIDNFFMEEIKNASTND